MENTLAYNFFQREGVFADRKHYSSISADYQLAIIPLLTQMSKIDRQELIHGLASAFTKTTISPPKWRWEAGSILCRMAIPWPFDFRLDLQESAKHCLLSAFSKVEDLDKVCYWQKNNGDSKWSDGPGYILHLYGILIVIATDEELEVPLNYLSSKITDTRLRMLLGRVQSAKQGIRLSSQYQMSEIEYRRHAISTTWHSRSIKD